MKIEKLEVGQVYKNYKAMCEQLEEKVLGGDSKIAQLKEWNRYFEYSKQGYKFAIDEIYEAAKDKHDLRVHGGNSFRTPLLVTNPLLASEWMSDKNGTEIPELLTRTSTDDYWWKCSRCLNEVFTSPARRINGSKGFTDEAVTCPYCGLSKDAKKIYETLEKYDIKFTQEYSFKDLLGTGNRMLRFDFAIFNECGKLVSLIEFDGGFHDEHLNPSSENHQVVSIHDDMKNEYCVQNNIPLLRVHHTQINNHYLLLCKHFQELDIEQYIKDSLLSDYETIRQQTVFAYEKERLQLLSKLDAIESVLNSFKLEELV